MNTLSQTSPKATSPGFVDAQFWDRLRDLDPEEVCRRACADYDRVRKGYALRILNDDYLALPGERLVERLGPPAPDGKPPGFYLYFLAVHYLLNAQERPLAGKMVAPKELRDGELFFSGGSHTPNLTPLVRRFDGQREALWKAAEAIGGRRVDFGDAAVEVPALPRVPVTLILWFGDAEFPARASVLFDRSVTDHLPIEGLLPAISETVKRLTP